MPGVTGVSRRRKSPSDYYYGYGDYATPAGYRLRSRHSRLASSLAWLASRVWESHWLVRQALVAGAVFLLVLGFMSVRLPALGSSQAYVRHFLTTDLDFRGAAQYVMSTDLRERVSSGWQMFPELWNRLTGHGGAGQPAPAEASFALPVDGTITSTYGYRSDPVTGEVAFHTGIDIGAAEGTPIVAALGGTVLKVEESDSYGNVVEIDHGQGVVTLYGHAKEVLVKVGDTVEQGDQIATVGMTGKATSPNCHFEILVSGQPVDPLQMKGLASTSP